MNGVPDFITAYMPDIILLLIILIWGFIKGYQGFIKCVLSVVVIVLAVAAGIYGSKALSEPVGNFVWDRYGPKIEEKFDKELDEALSGGKNAIDKFKESWSNVLESTGISQFNGIISTIKGIGSPEGNSAAGAAESAEKPEAEAAEENDITVQQKPADSTLTAKLKDTVMKNAEAICRRVCNIVLFIIITLVALLVLTLLKDWISNVRELPVIGGIDRFAGFVLGVAEATLVLMIIIRAAGGLGIDFFKENSANTILLKWFCGEGLDTGFINNWFN